MGSFSSRRAPVNFPAANVLGVCSLHILWTELYVTSECKRILELPEIAPIVSITTQEGFRRSSALSLSCIKKRNDTTVWFVGVKYVNTSLDRTGSTADRQRHTPFLKFVRRQLLFY